MRKLWALPFLAVPVFGVWSFWISPGQGWWMPENVSTYGGKIDHLFNVILVITGITFVGTEVVLAWFLFKYAEGGPAPRKAHYVHGHHTIELIWTLIPAAILVFIAFYQMATWKEVKFRSSLPQGPPLARVVAWQFEWRVFYPGDDGKLGTLDDIVSVNKLYVPVNQPVVILLRSRDVLHSFFLPNLRLKQDAVPGMEIPVWFQVTREGEFDLPCAELCGWGHYKMKGRLVVLPPYKFAEKLGELKKEQMDQGKVE